MSSVLDPIPESHRTAVRRALTETFGRASVRAVASMDAGRSGSLVYRVDVGERSAVLRIITQRTPLRDPARQFAAMHIASEDGIAPRVYYANADDGVAISAYIDAVPSGDAFATNLARITDLGHRVRRLHDGPAFPVFLDAFQCIEQALEVIAASGATLPPMLAAYLDEFAEVRAALEPHCVLYASHNDLNPGNLLFDGVRPWIIDWESAWQNDPMFDVATLLHWFGFTAEQERALLQGYFRGAPNPVEAARLRVMRQTVSCYYAMVFLLLTLQAGELPPPLDPDPARLPSFAEARMGLRAGTLALESAADRVRFALVMINDARRAASQPQFAQAMARLVASRP
jgi:Ser/Thr protein kinase RdoA (MazF antagonist)